jgi:exodeoxyribonuclease VIII
MLDLETMGNGSNSAIIAIGAVRFDKDVTDKFYINVSLESSVNRGLEMDADTVMWWMKQSNEARSAFIGKKGEYLKVALQKFTDFVEKVPFDALMWGNGAGFDNVILSNAYKKCRIGQPWAFWNDRCYRTVKNLNQNIKMDRVGTLHNALDDAESQAVHLMNILNR